MLVPNSSRFVTNPGPPVTLCFFARSHRIQYFGPPKQYAARVARAMAGESAVKKAARLSVS
ncbi:MAG TPA: hypothetical protein VNI02_19235 [Blastocatellia bacterium]|nr:hypothetical protein [Blastocatellia bacterium]